MERWSVLALAVAAATIAGPAFAQSPGGGATPQTQQSPSQPAQPDTMKSESPQASQAGRMGNREQVTVAQEALKEKGFDPGPIDGMMGPKTQAALRDFQKTEQLDQTGRLDAETMAKLGVQAKAGGANPAASPRTGDKDPTVPGPSPAKKKQAP